LAVLLGMYLFLCRVTFLMLFGILASLPLFAESTSEERRTVEERRVEEQKRASLQSSEASLSAKKQEQERPSRQTEQLFDRLELAYVMDMMQKKVTYRYDACKAVMIIKGIENEYLDLNSQLAYLQENKILPKKYRKEFDTSKPLRKGLFALMLAKTLGIKGGISPHLFPHSERYALKEMAFAGVLSDTHKNDLVSGSEFVTAVMQAKRTFQNQSTKA
jgi:hypothetical protein